jgi:hypothetical protein
MCVYNTTTNRILINTSRSHVAVGVWLRLLTLLLLLWRLLGRSICTLRIAQVERALAFLSASC